MGLTTDHLSSYSLIQHTEDLSTMRVEPAVEIANRGLMKWVLKLDRQGVCTHYQVLGVLWIGKREWKESVWYQCDVIFAIRWKQKKEERKAVYSCVSWRTERKVDWKEQLTWVEKRPPFRSKCTHPREYENMFCFLTSLTHLFHFGILSRLFLTKQGRICPHVFPERRNGFGVFCQYHSLESCKVTVIALVSPV